MLLAESIDLTPLVRVEIELIRPSITEAGAKRPLVADRRSPFSSVRFHFHALNYAPVVMDWHDLFPRENEAVPPAGQGTHRLSDGTTLSTRLLSSLEVNTWVVLSHYGLLPRLTTPAKAA